MRDVLSEYGFLVGSVIAGTMVFGFFAFISTHYKEFSKNFIGCITGSYVSYESDITLQEIEEGLY